MNAKPQLKALVFDAYGTLFDVHSVISLCEERFPGKGKELSQLWRSKQLEYTWLRSLIGAYRDFEHITADALVFACKALGLDLKPETQSELMAAYLHLTPYPDVPGALRQFGTTALGILSNGAPKMLNAVVDNAGLQSHFAHVISVDEVKIFKPSPKVYQLAADRFRVKAAEIGFVSSNCWDVVGATYFGFKAFWINRAKQALDELGAEPVKMVNTLEEIAAFMRGAA